LAPLRGRDEANRRAKPYNIVRDISIHGPRQWLGGAYIVKANPREVFENVIVIISHDLPPQEDARRAAILPIERPSTGRREK
jgi:hypothetical protein